MGHPLLTPTRTERVNRARADLAMGLPCHLSDGSHQALIAALEPLSTGRFAALQAELGVPELVISASRARAIMTPAAAANLGPGPVRIRPPEAADEAWYRRVMDPKHDHLAGAIGPLHVLRKGAGPIHGAALALVKSAELLPAVALFPLGTETGIWTELAPTRLTAAEVRDDLAANRALHPVAAAQFPIEAHDVSRLHVFRDPDGLRIHQAVVIGVPDLAQPVLTRLHSACFTGDVLGSLKCDCGPQLRAGLAQLARDGGLLLYLNQEGRGIGLANKMRAYDLQSRGLDTVQANHQLGFEDDERDFRLAATLLNQLGVRDIRLLTNNPGKERVLEASGIRISERVPLRVGQNAHNAGYLSIKAAKSGHFL